MKARFLLAATVAVLPALHAPDVHAQAFLSDPRLADGKGVKVGDYELHPGVAAEVGYDSNYFQRSGTGREAPVYDFARLRFTPSLSFQSFGQRDKDIGGAKPAVVFNGRLGASYNVLFDLTKDDVRNQNHVAANASLGADIHPQDEFGADISGAYIHMVEASNDPDTANAFRRHVIRGIAGLNWRPGAGVLSWRLGYQVTANLFEEDAFKGYDNLQHRIETTGRWRFLPRTQILYKGDVTFLDFTNNPATLTNGQTVRSQVGVNGLLTNHLGLLGLAGWGATFYGDRGPIRGQDFDSFIGQAEATWYPTPQRDPSAGSDRPPGLSTLSVGYNRNFSTAYLGSYYQRDRAYVNTVTFFAQRFVLNLSGGLSFITRPTAFFADGTYRPESAKGETRVDGVAFLEYRPAPTLGVGLTFRYDAQLKEKRVPLSETDPTVVDDMRFSRFQAYLGLRWFL